MGVQINSFDENMTEEEAIELATEYLKYKVVPEFTCLGAREFTQYDVDALHSSRRMKQIERGIGKLKKHFLPCWQVQFKFSAPQKITTIYVYNNYAVTDDWIMR